jgi:hypothetical protein
MHILATPPYSAQTSVFTPVIPPTSLFCIPCMHPVFCTPLPTPPNSALSCLRSYTLHTPAYTPVFCTQLTTSFSVFYTNLTTLYTHLASTPTPLYFALTCLHPFFPPLTCTPVFIIYLFTFPVFRILYTFFLAYLLTQLTTPLYSAHSCLHPCILHTLAYTPAFCIPVYCAGQVSGEIPPLCLIPFPSPPSPPHRFFHPFRSPVVTGQSRKLPFHLKNSKTFLYFCAGINQFHVFLREKPHPPSPSPFPPPSRRCFEDSNLPPPAGYPRLAHVSPQPQ